MNEIRVIRKVFTDKSTIGELFIEEDRFCYTLEDTCRAGMKIAGVTAIPAGTYQVVMTYSKRFQKVLPELLGVPGFTGIRIHAGNGPESTEGCILVGMRSGPDVVYDSQKAMANLMPEIESRLKLGKLYISISGGRST